MSIVSFMATGDIPQAGIETFAGIMALVAIAGVFLGFFMQVRTIKKQTQKEYDDRINKERDSIRREVELETTLRDLKGAVERMTENIRCLTESMNLQVTRIDRGQESQSRQLVKVVEATKAAHKRIDEHRRIDHGLSNHQYHEIENISDTED